GRRAGRCPCKSIAYCYSSAAAKRSMKDGRDGRSAMLVKKVLRRLVNVLLKRRRLPGPFHKDQGNCWIAPLPWWQANADSSTSPYRSPLVVFEDGMALKRAHSPHDEIRALGGGRYSHWGDHVFFSTSDNTNPHRNGRVYSCALSAELFRRHVGNLM